LLKLPDLPYFETPHPMSSMSDAALAAAADSIYEGIAEIVAKSLPPSKTGKGGA
jgi:hypothetical protein